MRYDGRTDFTDWADTNGFFLIFLLEIRTLVPKKIRFNLPNPPNPFSHRIFIFQMRNCSKVKMRPILTIERIFILKNDYLLAFHFKIFQRCNINGNCFHFDIADF
jgi:hypothetical protein